MEIEEMRVGMKVKINKYGGLRQGCMGIIERIDFDIAILNVEDSYFVHFYHYKFDEIKEAPIKLKRFSLWK